MEDKHLLFVKDVMKPVVLLEAYLTASDALQRLVQHNSYFCILGGTESEVFTVITREQLVSAHSEEQILSLATYLPHQISVSPHASLNFVVEILAEEFIHHLNLMGLVVQEQGRILGVLPRENVEKYAESIGVSIPDPPSGQMLEGISIAVVPEGLDKEGKKQSGFLYRCPICPGPEEKRVRYTSRTSPPTCSKGHKMNYIPE